MPESTGKVTLLPARLREGHQEASNHLVPLVCAELRRMVGAYMQRERPGHTFQVTALVAEAHMRMVGGEPASWQARANFFANAAHTRRQVLLDHARRRRAEKRGGADARKVDIEADLLIAHNMLEDVIAINEVIERFAQIDPARQSRLIELRFFTGLTVEESTEVTGVSAFTNKHEWRSAKAWPHRELAATKPE